MRAWLKALLSETVLSLLWILSALSTLATFFFHGWVDDARPVLGVSAAVAFAWANYKVFQKQQSQISALGKNLQLPQPATSSLTIAVDRGSRYILRPVQSEPGGNFSGIFLEFHLMIENTGRRNSTVEHFQIEIMELKRTFPNLEPQEKLHGIQGRHCMYGMDPANPYGLSKTGLIKIEPEDTTIRGTLIFHIPDVDFRVFAECNLTMNGQSRRFPHLHCRLTVTDTTQTSASQIFEMPEE